MMLRDIVAGISRPLAVHVKNDSGSMQRSKCDKQLLPLLAASPPRDDLFIDDASDIDVTDQYEPFCYTVSQECGPLLLLQ